VESRAEHEVGLAAFLKPERRERFRDSLGRDTSRRKLQQELYHFERRLDERCSELQEQHTKHDEHVALVYTRLVAAGAPEQCFVLAADEQRPQHQLALRQAVEDLMFGGAGFISCVPGRLGAYVSENGSNVYILHRKR
jgi:hypothetical protein